VAGSSGARVILDAAAIPPYIYCISPNIGVSGVPGYIPICGAYLAPQGTTPQVSMDGATFYIVVPKLEQDTGTYDRPRTQREDEEWLLTPDGPTKLSAMVQ
jgi:hypothetical protein